MTEIEVADRFHAITRDGVTMDGVTMLTRLTIDGTPYDGGYYHIPQ